MVKTVNQAAPLVGDQAIYTLTVTNNGPDDTSGVEVTDALPAGVSHVSDDSEGAYVPGDRGLDRG